MPPQIVRRVATVVVTDGRGNVPLKASHSNTITRPVTHEGIEDALQQAREIKQVKHVSSFVLSPRLRYYSREQLDLALDYYQRSLSLFEQVGNPSDIARSLHNIGYTYYSQDKWQDALPLFSRSLSLSEQMGRGFESYVADELEMIAKCYVKLGEVEKGFPYYERAQEIREQLKGE